MHNIFAVLHRLTDSRPFTEAEQALAHTVIEETEQLIGHVIEAAGITVTPDGVKLAPLHTAADMTSSATATEQEAPAAEPDAT